jgi:hypothetical protein
MKNIFKNILTTIAGAFAGLPLIFNGVQTHDEKTLITGIGVFLIGLFSKDHNQQ